MSEKADLLYMFCIEKRKEAKRSEKNTQNKARKQPACPENDYSGGQARKPSKEVRVPTVRVPTCGPSKMNISTELRGGGAGRGRSGGRGGPRGGPEERKANGGPAPGVDPRGPGRRLSPGCRAVQTPSRHCRGTVEALSRPCLSSLSRYCQVPVEPVEPDSMRLGVEFCRGLSSSCRAVEQCRADE